MRIAPYFFAILPMFLFAVAAADNAAQAELTEAEILAKADQRIEQHRKADAVVVVVDAAGKPVPGAKVQVEQTRHAFLFGCNFFKWGLAESSPGDDAALKKQADYRQRFAELLNYATLAFYWPSYEREQGQPRHDYTERAARWCCEHGIAVKGHPLAWNYSEPRWLPDDSEKIRQLQMARIKDCVTRFRGLIDRWDVVNEVTHFDRDQFLVRAPKFTAMWREVGQLEFTRQCFLEARRAAPDATLLINDYRTDPAYERVIEQLVDDNGKRLYDVIGIQSHMHGGAWPTEKIWEVCQRYARFGVPLHFTETTILSGQRSWEGPKEGPWVTTPEGEAYQAREVARFYTVLFSHPAVEAITWWDFSDLGAWKRAPAGLVRADMTPKPAYKELMKLVKGKWWTKTAGETDANGTAKFRGFLGEYRVTVTVDGKQSAVETTELKKDEENRWVVMVK